MEAKFLMDDPIVAPIGQMELMSAGLQQMLAWVKDRRPECVPDGAEDDWRKLFPHACAETQNELLVELAGRKCYNSFGDKAGRKANAEYIANTQAGDIPHGSIMYHAKMAFFIGGVSRRVSHELIRHYVGADRDEEGSPSQESTRYVEHTGHYVVHPTIAADATARATFETAMYQNYASYLQYVNLRTDAHVAAHGEPPKGMDRKRILESASSFLSHSVETSFIWTTNPIALAKLLKERDHAAADAEFQRLAKQWKAVALQHWPNLFPQPWMQA